jgi:MFS superfamily sulfate permease-like transporter
MLGVPPPDVGAHRASGTVLKLWDTLGEIGQTSLATAAVSIAVLAVLIVFGRWVKAVPGGLVAVVGAILVSWAFDLTAHGVATLGHVPSGLPQIGLPSGVSWTQAAALGATSISIVLVILAQSAATSRAYAVKHEEPLVENDDLVGLSVANLAAGLTSTFVVNGSPTKTEIVDEAKSHTQVAQLTMAVTVAIVLLFLTKPLQYLPIAALSAVVFLIGVKLVDVAHMRDIWRLRRDEFWVAVVTAIVVVVVGVEEGIILAIVLSIALHVRRHYLPHDAIITWDSTGAEVERRPRPGTESEPGLIVYRFGVGLFYANAARLWREVIALVDVPSPPRWFVLLAEAIDDVDYTGGKTLGELADELHGRGVVLAIAEAGPHVARELERFGLTDRIGRDRVFETLADARRAFHGAWGEPPLGDRTR